MPNGPRGRSGYSVRCRRGVKMGKKVQRKKPHKSHATFIHPPTPPTTHMVLIRDPSIFCRSMVLTSSAAPAWNHVSYALFVARTER